MLRRTMTSLLVLAVATTMILVTPNAAEACSCGIQTLEEAVPGSSAVFIGREVDRYTNPRPDSDEVYVPPVLIVFEVDEWLSDGEAPLEVVVGTGRGSSDCGVGSMAGRGEIGIYAYGELGNLSISTCGGVANPDELRALLVGLPETVVGAPGFVVAQGLGDSRIAVLDDHGNVIGYGKGEGRVDFLASCPGGTHIIEVVGDEQSSSASGVELLDVRDIDSMEIVASHEVFVRGERPIRASNSIWWIRDLECHDAEGQTLSYLLPRAKWNALSGSELHTDGAEFVWKEGDDLTTIEVGDARAAAVAPHADLVMTVSGPDGEILTGYELSTGRQQWTKRIEKKDVAWDVAYSAELGLFALLANNKPLAQENRYFAAVDRLLVVGAAGDVVATHKFGERRVAMTLEAAPGGFMAATGFENQGGVQVALIDEDGSAVAEHELPIDSFVGTAAWGDAGPIAVAGQQAVTGEQGVGVVADVSRVRWIAAVRDGEVAPQPGQTETTTLVPAVTTATVPDRSTVTVAVSTTSTPGAGSNEAVGPDGEAATPVWPIVGGVALALLAAALLVASRPRNYLDGWSRDPLDDDKDD